LAQIQLLEEKIRELQDQLERSNNEIDDKLAKLEAAGSGSVSLARDLGKARERVARLESDLERLLGADGLVETLKLRLTETRCPKCSASFDANKAFGLTADLDKHVIHFRGSVNNSLTSN
jgi:chromosome segregation ATPase